MQITAVGVFIKDNKVLLEKRRKDEDNYANLLALPGGHIRKKETAKKALIREIKEELKVNIKKAKYLGRFRDIDPTSKDIFHHHAFLCREWEGDIKKTTEQAGIKWIDLNKIKKMKGLRKTDIRILKKARLV